LKRKNHRSKTLKLFRLKLIKMEKTFLKEKDN
jgi:hypothetical protein